MMESLKWILLMVLLVAIGATFSYPSAFENGQRSVADGSYQYAKVGRDYLCGRASLVTDIDSGEWK
ncbi:hypothetical protein L1P06_13405 [Edwardsiella piscicida]|uniref:hypothetical protein n=1 Tax=Edwardsiella piscicida TaxID=1263550 RepID=UPI001F37C7F2|nr:hypothetical protein [Edwardsiella piscicida]UJT78284.1 hypothetical protein L1P06_13405 [Edwardsiella piscicida]